MLRKCSVPGTCPTMAVWGHEVRHRNKGSDSVTPAVIPASTPTTRTVRMVAAKAAKSALEQA